MKVIITNEDVTNLKKFMLLYSKAAKKQKAISTYAIPLEFVVVGLVLDGLLKTVPVASIASVVLAGLWLIFYPKFYARMRRKHLEEAKNIQPSRVEMEFKVNEDIISFSKGDPKPSEKFQAKDLNRIVKSEKNYFLAFERGFHIVLPINDETSNIIKKLENDMKIDTQNLTLDQF